MKNCILLLFMVGWSVMADIPGFDGYFTLSSGPYKVEITGKNRFCIRKIVYDGSELGNDHGFYGTILATAPAKFIGSGHKEGGEEKVVAFSVKVDGKPVKYESGGEISGNLIEYSKISMLDNLKVFVSVVIDRNGIRLDKHFEAVASQDIYSFYIFQFCFTEKSTEWMIGRPDGTTAAGVFNSDDGWHLRSERNLLWFSQYVPSSRKGILGYFISYFPGQGSYMLWDKKVYHKFYFSAKLPKSVEKGMQSRHYSLFLKGFGAEPAEWKNKSKAIAAELVKAYPLPKPPETTRHNFDNLPGKVFELKGNGGFVCSKFPVYLKPDKDYRISFRIKKAPEVSKSPSDNYLIVGQYDKTRKFQVFGSFAARVPHDGGWHELKQSFRSPAVITDCSVYLYNKKTKASIWLDDLVISEQ